MAEESTVPEDHESLIDPGFTVVRRGYDQTEVRRALIRLASELSAGRERELLLTQQVAAAEERIDAIDPLDPAYLTKLLGDEVARILDAARSAAVEIRVRADDAATRLFDETKSEAAADAAAIVERAQHEAREILRVAEERRDAMADNDPERGSGQSSKTSRTGVDPSRTADLFASLRREQADAGDQSDI